MGDEGVINLNYLAKIVYTLYSVKLAVCDALLTIWDYRLIHNDIIHWNWVTIEYVAWLD